MIQVSYLTMLTILYMLIGAYVTAIYIEILRQKHLPKEYFLLMLPDDAIDFFTEHPNAWNASICITLLVLILIWPYVLTELVKNTE